MDLNNLGDFFAGLFGPLAVLWLIISITIQQKELSKSSEALALQAKELANSVEQQKQIIEISKRELSYKDKERKEKLNIDLDISVNKRVTSGVVVYKINYSNSINHAKDLMLIYKSKIIMSTPYIKANHTSMFEVGGDIIDDAEHPFKIIYTNSEGETVNEERKLHGSYLVKV